MLDSAVYTTQYTLSTAVHRLTLSRCMAQHRLQSSTAQSGTAWSCWDRQEQLDKTVVDAVDIDSGDLEDLHYTHYLFVFFNANLFS